MGNALVTTVSIYKVRLWVVNWLLQATQLLRGRIHLPTWLSLLAQLYQVSGQATGCLPREVIQEGQGLSWVSCCPSWAAGGQESSLAFEKSTEGDGAAGAHTFPKQPQSTQKLRYGQLCKQPVTAAGDSQPSLSPYHSPHSHSGSQVLSQVLTQVLAWTAQSLTW